MKLAVQTDKDFVTAAFASEEIELPADGSTTAALSITPNDNQRDW